MSKVIANASMSLDGFIAFEDNNIGELFEWYDNGEVEIVNEGELPPFHVTQASADYWRSWVDSLGVLVVGRELFDVTDGWHGKHPIGVPIVVVTHEPPRDWSYPGSEDFTFVTEGVAVVVPFEQFADGVVLERDEPVERHGCVCDDPAHPAHGTPRRGAPRGVARGSAAGERRQHVDALAERCRTVASHNAVDEERAVGHDPRHRRAIAAHEQVAQLADRAARVGCGEGLLLDARRLGGGREVAHGH